MSQPSGEPTVDLLTSLHRGLREEVRLALRRATEKGKAIVDVGEKVALSKGRTSTVQVTVTPVSDEGEDLLFVASFQAQSAPTGAPDAEAIDLSSLELEEELQRARDDLHVTIDRLEASNETLRLLNDDVTAMNEELQSTNQELEVSRKQSQSLNEQLAGLNRQLQQKVDELESATNDLANLLNSAHIATVFLDRECRVRLFTPAISGLMELRRGDAGRPIAHFARRFTDDALVDDAMTVLETLVSVEAVVRSDGGRWFLRRVVPYRTEGGRVDGVGVTLTDITLQRAAEDSLRRINEQLEERIRRRTALVKLLQDVAVIANSSMPTIEAFEATIERVCRDKSWMAGHAYLNRLGTAEDLGVWHVLAPHDPKRVRSLLTGGGYGSGEGLVGRVIETGEAPPGRATW